MLGRLLSGRAARAGFALKAVAAGPPSEVSLFFPPLSAAALAQPLDEPSDHEHGRQERDDHADVGDHIRENNSGAAVDAHPPVVGRMAFSVQR